MDDQQKQAFVDAFYDKLVETHVRLRDRTDYREKVDIGVRQLIALENRTKWEPLQVLVGLAQCQSIDRQSGRAPKMPDEQLEWLCAA